MEFGAKPGVPVNLIPQRIQKKQIPMLPVNDDFGQLELAGLLDAQALQSLMEDFYAIAQVPIAIVDDKGRVLVGIGWQEICLKYHRVHPVTCAHCLESDLLLTQGVPAGEFKLYKCKNHMWDIATPIMVGGRQVGNLFSGQFLFDDETPEYELFRAQARQYGFNEEAYIAALDQVPRLSRETVNRTMAFFVKLASMISLLSYTNLQLVHSLTERETLMRSLQESEQRWSTTLASVGDGVIATDTQGKITFINPVAEELTGWTYSEAEQKPVEDIFKIINESTRQEVDQPVRKVLQTGVIIGLANHTLLVRKDGTEIAIDDSGAPIHNAAGQTTGAVLVFRDITERRQVEREQAWLSSFPMRNPNPILEISHEDQIAYANPSALKLFPDILERGICHPYLAGWAEIANQIHSNPNLIVQRDVQVSDRYYQQLIYYVKEYNRIRTYGMDITQRKQAEETSQKYAEKLASSNRELEDFAFIASHDLNEPLRKIEAFGSRLVAVAGKLDEEEQDYLKRTINAARRMRQMVDGLLSLSRVTTQGQSFVSTDIGKILAEVLNDLEMQLSRTSGSVEACTLPVIQADPLQMRQLFQNLIGNALKYHRPGVPPKIQITCQTAPNTVQIHIQDNGIGFDEGQMERIFQPFQRLVGRDEFEGSGMGLAICRKIVERHGGAIVAHSNPGQGSTFVITLPTRPLH